MVNEDYTRLELVASAYDSLAGYEDNSNYRELDDAKLRLLQHIVKIIDNLEGGSEQYEPA